MNRAARAARDSAARFRPTFWPDAPLKSPLVELTETAEVDGDGWIEWDWSGLRPDPRPLRDEVVLRELGDVDATDVDALLAFAREHGVISQTAEDRLPYGLAPGSNGRRDGRLHINELSLYVRHAQALAWHWIAYTDDERVIGAWERAGIADAERRMRPTVDEDTAWAWFAGALNAGLAGLPPHVMGFTRLPGGGLIEYGEPTVDLYTALCVQLFNVMVEDGPIRTCANERCGKRFRRQRGRAEYGQYRTEGVRFCSRECAKAQGERERRRRQRKG
jgi:hypothetical protein